MKSNYILFLIMLVASTSFMQLPAMQYIQRTFSHQIDGYNNVGNTPLILAIEADDLGGVQYLLSHGADVNQTELYGSRKTPLMFAASNIHDIEANMIKLLIQHGARIDTQNTNDETALMYAIRADKAEAVRVLLNYRADLGITNNFGETPLDIAKQLNPGSDVIEILLFHRPAKILKNQ